MIRPFLKTLSQGRSLRREEAEAAMGLIMDGEATPAQIGAFAMGLRLKGESVAEIAGCAAVMRARAAGVRCAAERLIDTCGTGGDGASTFNISTAAAFVAAAGGAVVAKHGNRAVSSACGSADVMEALGVRLDIGVAGVERCLAEVGFGFLFAPHHHAALRHAAAPRREIGVRTIFNILGPLSNPAGARRQLLGVFDASLVPVMAEVLAALGSESALVVHGRDGLDEITVTGPTLVAELRGGDVQVSEWTPEMVGVPRGAAAELVGGDAAANAALLESLFRGTLRGAPRDIVRLNAGAALLAAGLVDSWGAGVDRATGLIDSGAALDRLEQLRRLTNRLGASATP